MGYAAATAHPTRNNRNNNNKPLYYRRLFLHLIRKSKRLPVERSLRNSICRLIVNLFLGSNIRLISELRNRLQREFYRGSV